MTAPIWDWNRRCSGSQMGTPAAPWCGQQATVVVIAVSRWEEIRQSAWNSQLPLPTSVEELGHLQWYACDDPEHQKGGVAISLAEFAALMQKWKDDKARDAQQREAARMLERGGDEEPRGPTGAQGPTPGTGARGSPGGWGP